MDYKDEQFDVIMLFNVVENIPNPEQFLKAVNRKLKKGGYFILNFVDMRHNLIEKIQKGKYFLYRPPICYIYDKELLTRVLKKFGFEVASIHRDIRSMHLEKILTLLGWNLPLKFFRMLRIHQIPFSIYAYPSRIVVARRIK
jgi:ubiquinone/menaquinone biosynthesis C-methylase UbiE